MKEKANVQSAAPRKVKGTVLFTVVCVMMVLIVFLMGTLALASTANKRANENFQKEQTETIARTVLDSVAKAIHEDTTNNGIKSEVMKGHSVTVTLDSVPYDVEVVPVGNSRSVYDDVVGWVQGDLYEIRTTVTTGAGNAETVYSMYMVTGTGEIEDTPDDNPPPNDKAFESRGKTTGMGTAGFISGGTSVGGGAFDPNWVS
ncbi:MAG: hypothetical protein IIZ34_05375, partial [Eubacterium sp.]|nr:hypothetical protein [Eubacterium sp.]